MSRRARCAPAIAGSLQGQLLHRGPGRRPHGLRVGALGAACHRAARIWPNVLRVRIEEQPLALWNENQMINTWGEAFTATRARWTTKPCCRSSPDPKAPSRWWCSACRAGALVRAAGHARQATRTESPLRLARRCQRHVAGPGPDPGADAPDPHGRAGRAAVRGAHSTFCAGVARRGRTPGRAHHHQADLRYPNGFALALAPLPPSEPSPNPYRNLPRNANAMTRDIRTLSSPSISAPARWWLWWLKSCLKGGSKCWA